MNNILVLFKVLLNKCGLFFNSIATAIGLLTSILFVLSQLTWHNSKQDQLKDLNQIHQALNTHFSQLNKIFNWQGHLLIESKGREFSFSFGQSKGQKWNKNTSSLIASVSKPFVAQALFELFKQGRINLNDSICKFIKSECLSPDIRIFNLLNHTSGLSHSPSILKALKTDIWTNFTSSPLDKIVVMRSPLEGIPNKKYNYLNFNFVLASKVIENVTQKKFSAAMEELIFKPYQLTQTSLFNHRNRKNLALPGCPTLAPFYWKLKCSPEMIAYESFYGAGGITSSTKNLIQFAQSVAKSGIYKVPLENIAFSQSSFQYQLGWVKSKQGFYWHNGATLGYSSELISWPEKKLYIALLSNTHPSEEISFYLKQIRPLISQKTFYSPLSIRWIPKIRKDSLIMDFYSYIKDFF